jgi:hypothetical protein
LSIKRRIAIAIASAAVNYLIKRYVVKRSKKKSISSKLELSDSQ